MSKSKTLVYFGNERLVSGLTHTDAPLLRGLIERGYTVAALISHHHDAASRKHRVLEVAEIANEHNIPLILSDNMQKIAHILDTIQPDAAILAAYGNIIPQPVIDMFPDGIINLHPSLLPAYRGPTPIETPILKGDSATGVSIMQLTAGMDSGPVYVQQSVDIAPDIDKFTLCEHLHTLGASLLLDNLDAILDGSLQPTPQDDSRATFSKLIIKSDGILDTDKPAVQLEREVRAYAGWPGTRTTLGSVDVIVTKSHVSDTAEELSLRCKDGNYLVIDYLKPAGKKEMPAGAFLAGYKDKIS